MALVGVRWQSHLLVHVWLWQYPNRPLPSPCYSLTVGLWAVTLFVVLMVDVHVGWSRFDANTAKPEQGSECSVSSPAM